MDMEEIILEHMAIREWVDWFVKDALKENLQNTKPVLNEKFEKASA